MSPSSLLLALVCLCARPDRAGSMVDPGFSNCKEFFYRETTPKWFTSDTDRDICQNYYNIYFATKYDTGSRIPLWSAYRLDTKSCRTQPTRRQTWFVEPQVFSLDKVPQMTTEARSGLSIADLKSTQAINEDYQDTSYDRGHLNPFLFQCDQGRTATFTLTNAAPMDPCFIRVRWYKLEKALKDQLQKECNDIEGDSYLITGTVPSQNRKIPDQAEDEEGDRTRDYDRVSVPSHVWTAVCCDHAEQNRTFSFAFLGENQEESQLETLSVAELNGRLRDLYGKYETIQLFADECCGDSKNRDRILSLIKAAVIDSFKAQITDDYSLMVPESKRAKLDKDTQEIMQSEHLKKQNLLLRSEGYDHHFESLAEWFNTMSPLYREDKLACVLTAPSAVYREVAQSDGGGATCSLTRDIQGTSKTITASGYLCTASDQCGYKDYSYSWCYTTTDEKNYEYCCVSECSLKDSYYQCWNGYGDVPCSPQYSTVTVNRTPCRPDQQCAKYGKDYYWCYTDYSNNWEYCCSPTHYCDDHGYGYRWCYTDDPHSNWKYC
ncbi:ENDD1 protein, partial [Atractosteus spatula]|nr:ENDD1 protein [Atractosteus spatula]